MIKKILVFRKTHGVESNYSSFSIEITGMILPYGDNSDKKQDKMASFPLW